MREDLREEGENLLYRVNDVFTVQDGEWYVSSKKYSIDKEHLDKYVNADIPQRGAATHLIAKVPSGARVQIINRYNNSVAKDFISVGVWFDFPMDHGAAYNPDRGETGPWNLVIDGVTVVAEIGLPFSWHVSTYVVVEDDNIQQPEVPGDGPTIPEEPSEQPEGDTIWVNVFVGDVLYAGWLKPTQTSFVRARE